MTCIVHNFTGALILIVQTAPHVEPIATRPTRGIWTNVAGAADVAGAANAAAAINAANAVSAANPAEDNMYDLYDNNYYNRYYYYYAIACAGRCVIWLDSATVQPSGAGPL